MKKTLFLSGVLALAPIAGAANQTFIFNGVIGLVSTTITNPYDGAVATLIGMYNVNTTTYSGQGAGNTLLMTNSADLITLDSAGTGQLPDVQTLIGVQRIITGNGDDFLDMASANFSLPAENIFGGSGNETIWSNAGDDTITPGNGNDTIDAGPGDDLVHSFNGHYTIDGGAGADTVTFQLAMSSYSITPAGPGSATITGVDNTTIDIVTNVESAQFSDQTISLLPEPSVPFVIAAAAAAAVLSPRRRKRVAI